MRFEWERLLRACTLPPTTKLVGLMLATHANGDGTQAHPGQDRLARQCGLRPRAVRNHLDALSDLGLIVRTFLGSSAGRSGRADVYRLEVPTWLPAGVAPDDWDPLPGADPDHRHPRAGDREKNTGTVVPNTGTHVPEHRHPRATHHAFTSPEEPPPPTPSAGDDEAADDQEVEEAHASLRDVLAAVAAAWRPQLGGRDLENLTPAVAAALRQLDPSQLIKHLTGNTVGAKNPAAVLRARLDNLPTSRRLPAAVPWCGQCVSPEHRWLEVDGALPQPCPRCSPQANALARSATANGGRARAGDAPGRTPPAHVAPGDLERAAGRPA